MKQRAVTLAVLMFSVVLAGCTDSGDKQTGPTSAECLEQGLILNATAVGGPACEEAPFVIRSFEEPDHDCVVTKQRDRVHAPDLVGNPWVLGQSWDYSLVVDGEDLGATKLVYYADQDFLGGQAQHYMVGTTTRDEALHHALFSENPMIGRVHRILYSPHESGDHADMFHFPLCEGSSWQTVFYGEVFTLTASKATLAVPGGADEGFLIEGTSADGGTLSLSYSPAIQWFTFIKLTRGDGGTVDMTLTATGAGYTGAGFFLRGQKDESVAFSGTVLGQDALPLGRESGAEGDYDTIGVYARLEFTGQGQYTVDLLDPNGTVQWTVTFGGLGGVTGVDEVFEVPFSVGEWSIRRTSIPPGPLGATVEGEMQFVSIYDRSGSL